MLEQNSVALDRPEAYDYPLPYEKIAQFPVEPRHTSRLMTVNRENGKIAHHFFYELPKFLDPKRDWIVVNNSKVLPLRLYGKRIGTEGAFECVLLNPVENENLQSRRWEAIAKCGFKQKRGVEILFSSRDQSCTLNGRIERGTQDIPDSDGVIVIEFDQSPLSIPLGEIPLPPYMERNNGPTTKDEQSYQTIFAQTEARLGSAAAPTAGLHFSLEMIEQMKKQGFHFEEITLHVGIGTFRPVKAKTLDEHKMHTEHFEIRPEVADRLNQHRASGGRILAVGTTTVRALESSFRDGAIQRGLQSTALFLHPKNAKFQVIDSLLTNFHLPKSTLLMLISAFGGYENIREAYQEALREDYRFFSYGDAMWIQ